MKSLAFLMILFPVFASAAKMEIYCKDKWLADAPSWKVVLNDETLEIIPNPYFPEKAQKSQKKITMVRVDYHAGKPLPVGTYSGKNDKGQALNFQITSLDLVNSIDWSDTNFYNSYMGIGEPGNDTDAVELSCNGPKMGIQF